MPEWMMYLLLGYVAGTITTVFTAWLKRCGEAEIFCLKCQTWTHIPATHCKGCGREFSKNYPET